MASQRTHSAIMPGVIAAVILAIIVTFPAAGFQGERERKGMPEEQRLIQSLEGPALFQAYCAACHGKDAKGNGPAASALKTPPPDLTRISQKNGGKFPMVRVQKIISGEDLEPGAHGSRQMPVWGPIFHQISWDQDLGSVRIYNLAKHLESLQQK